MTDEPGDVAPGMPPTGAVEPHRGTLVLVFGALGLFVCLIFGILAWVWANRDLAKMRAGMMDPAGEEYTRWGRTLGIIRVVVDILTVVAATLFVVIRGVPTSWIQSLPLPTQ
jgi:hypothetical protein